MGIEWTDSDYIHYITNTTKKYNLDNISRTEAYQSFYLKHPEIKWSFLASIVSRNAGWNMTDLYLPPFQDMLDEQEKRKLFMTYERANWLIFSDAYPQLLVYQLSNKYNRPYFYLLSHYHVSAFMIAEWYHFWKTNDEQRLMNALIINEQHVIQNPVIKIPYFKYRVFMNLPYLIQDILRMSAVLLPTQSTKLYGEFVHNFSNVDQRIMLGKRIAASLFHKNRYPLFYDFAIHNPPTGSREDYEKYFNKKHIKSPMLRMVYPIINHQDRIRREWYDPKKIKNKWFQGTQPVLEEIGESFYKKRHMIYAYYHFKQLWT